jgi:NitT/TauT family transport system ATP-binding protein
MKMPVPVIEVKDVTLFFDSGRERTRRARVRERVRAHSRVTTPELSGVNLQIKEGEIVNLVGPSGCGKSTLLRLICGVLTPTEGWIRVYGRKAVPGRSDLGFVPQDALLFPWRTVLANVRLPLEVKAGEKKGEELNKKAREALRLANLEGVEEKYPYQLSGGMKQRAALARGLVTGNRILLLDEPFAALDDITRTQLQLELLNLQARMGSTILLVTHNIFEAVFLSGRVVVMGEKPGRILGEVVVDLDYPRNLRIMGTPGFSRKVGEVQAVLEKAWRD